MQNDNFDFFKIKNYFAENSEVKSILIQGKEPEEWPFITIAIPTYKRIKTLREAIESALNQIGDTPSYNVIIVDNNPERGDETEHLMCQYKNRSNVLYYKNAENIGMAGNWSRLYELAKSEWVVMLHDDDLLSAYYLQEICKCLNNETVERLGGISALFITQRNFHDGEEIQDIKPDCPIELRKLTLRDNFIYPTTIPCAPIIRRQAVLELGGYTKQNFAPDAFFLKLLHVVPTYKINLQLSYYRMGINESTKLSAMEEMCEMNYWSRFQVWGKLCIPRFIQKLAMPYANRNFEKLFQDSWNSNFHYSRVRGYSKLQLKISRIVYKVLHEINRVIRVITRKKIVID